MRDVAIFAVAVAVLLHAAVMWSADRYEYEPHVGKWGEAVQYGWRMDKRTGELCTYMRSTGLDCEQPDPVAAKAALKKKIREMNEEAQQRLEASRRERDELLRKNSLEEVLP